MSLKMLPYSYHWILNQKLKEVRPTTVLDLGCSDGSLMKSIAEKDWEITGVELDKNYAEKARKTGIYNKVYVQDIINLSKDTLNKKYDVVFISQVIEHIDKNIVLKTMSKWENLTNKRIVISTPIGFIDYEPLEESDIKENPLQEHKSGWEINELQDMDYIVRGQGARFIYGQNGLAKKYSSLKNLWYFCSYMLSPWMYYNPHYAMYMIAYKNK